MPTEDYQLASVIEALPNMQFRVRVQDGRLMVAFVSRLYAGSRGKPKLPKIDEQVDVELSPYDDDKCRIVRPIRNAKVVWSYPNKRRMD